MDNLIGFCFGCVGVLIGIFFKDWNDAVHAGMRAAEVFGWGFIGGAGGIVGKIVIGAIVKKIKNKKLKS
jgi:hypothetical protein